MFVDFSLFGGAEILPKGKSALSLFPRRTIIPDSSASTDAYDARLSDQSDFLWIMTEEPHRSRRMAIMKAHPEVSIRLSSCFSLENCWKVHCRCCGRRYILSALNYTRPSYLCPSFSVQHCTKDFVFIIREHRLSASVYPISSEKLTFFAV